MAEKLKLTVKQLLDLRSGLNSLDAVRTVRDGQEVEITVFDFDFKTRYALMKTAQAVGIAAALVDKIERQEAAKIGVYDQMAKTPENVQKASQYNAAVAEMRENETEVDGVFFVKLSDLLNKPMAVGDKVVRTNPIPQSVINRLVPIIMEETA